MSNKIYCMSHKSFDVPKNPLYHPLHVGKALSNASFGYTGDDSGDNISTLNPNFGELTGMYWVWKNTDTKDAIGICHYRRYLANKNRDLFLDEEIDSILKEYDIIAPIPHNSPSVNRDNYAEAHNIDDFSMVRNAISKLSGDYLESFDAMASSHTSYYANLMIMPSSLYKTYCEWLFPILFDAWEHIDVSEYNLYEARVMGFLSETLLGVWTQKNGYRVYEADVICTDEKAETKELKLAVSQLIKNNDLEGARELFNGIINLRPDITLPMSDILGEIPIIDHILYIGALEKDNGIEGFYIPQVGLYEMINRYNKSANIFLTIRDTGLSREAFSYLKTIQLSPIAAAVILMGTMSDAFEKTTGGKKLIIDSLCDLFNTDDIKWLYENVK